MSSDGQGKRWCFTINNPTAADFFWENEDLLRAEFEYVVLQEEVGEHGTRHIQGFFILKKKKRCGWVRSHCSDRGHYEIARGTNQQASDYCKKSDTHPEGGLRFEWGVMPERKAAPKHSDRLAEAMEEVDLLKQGYKRPEDVGSSTLLLPGYIQAYKLLTQAKNGPFRPDLKIITIIGPPGCGKSYALFKHFPDAGKAIYGNSGLWWSNPTANVLFLEEFTGQIKLQLLLELLDPYPHQIEVKGGMAPMMARVICITSNVPPDQWYREGVDGDTMAAKRNLSLNALYDRIGYHNATGSGRQVRRNAYYMEPQIEEGSDQPYLEQIMAMREWIFEKLDEICEDLGPWYSPPSDDED